MAGDALPPACAFSARLTAATETDTVDSLVGRADRALYLAKKAGRGHHCTLEHDADAFTGPAPVPS